MRNAFSKTLYECGQKDSSIAMVVADISPAGSMAKFSEEYPDRFINVGVAEQVMIGMCAGMALKGLQPFAYTIATFSLYRPFEMVRDDLCYQNLPVTVVGMGSGVVYSNLGGTHHTMEDVAIATALPNMQVICPCDPLETIEATKYCASQKTGPVYLKLGKAGEPTVTQDALDPFEIGKIRYLKKGADVCILTYGLLMPSMLEVASQLEKQGKSVSVVSVHTIKPLDRAGIVEALQSHAQVIVVEENVPHGALGSRVKEIAWDVQATCNLRTMSLKDEFIHCYGTYHELLDAHGISVDKVVAALNA